ncbi:MAG: hypothetical protein ACR2GH_15165 [Pseudonocardia sp.]
MRRLSVDAECKDGFSCPSVHADDTDPGHLVIVGVPVLAGTVPLGPGEIAIRVKRQVIADAGIR